MNTQDLANALIKTGYVTLFTDCSGDPKRDAQRNLEGRTHFVDDATLRYHRSRIVGRVMLADGLLFAIIHSDALDPWNLTRGFRFTVFDVWGTVVGSMSLEEAVSTSDKARKLMWAWYEGFDPVLHYRDALARLVDRKRREADDLASIFA